MRRGVHRTSAYLHENETTFTAKRCVCNREGKPLPYDKENAKT